jgi:hypothetical protein
MRVETEQKITPTSGHSYYKRLLQTTLHLTGAVCVLRVKQMRNLTDSQPKP